MKAIRAAMVGLLFFSVAGCGRPPDEVQTFKTPLRGVTLTFETWNNGPLVSDTNSLIAHYAQGDKETSQRILDGDYAVFSKFFWAAPRRLVLCYKKGSIYNFTNEVIFQPDDDNKNFHVVLKEDC